MAPGRSWLPVALVGAGVITLAASGVGIAAAVPAGLAGAALISSTLAAFGPGEMIGDMATLAALARVGSAMAVGGGAAFGTAGPTRSEVNLIGVALADAIASRDPAQLRSLLISLLTLTSVQERLGHESQRATVLTTSLSARGALARRAPEHNSIDPKSENAKAVREMLMILDKACRWLRGEEKTSTLQAERWRELTTSYAAAVEEQNESLVHVLASSRRPNNDPPELTMNPESPENVDVR